MTTGTGLFRNTSNQRVILRCIGPEAFFQVEVVFPFENWRFRSPPPRRGADAGEPRDLSLVLRLGGTNVRVSTNRDADHQVKSRGIATVSCRGKILRAPDRTTAQRASRLFQPLGLRPCPREPQRPATRLPTQARSASSPSA